MKRIKIEKHKTESNDYLINVVTGRDDTNSDTLRAKISLESHKIKEPIKIPRKV